MATLRQHLAGIDAALATKPSAPSNEGTFAPTLIDLSGGQKEYNSYTQVGAIAFALDPAKTPMIGGSVQVNIRGGGFAITYPFTFVGLEGLASGTILAAGVDYPFIFRLGKDWAEVSPGVFQDRVLVIMGKSLTSTHQVVTALAAQAGYSISRTSAFILVELTQDMNAAGTFTLPASPALGDIVHLVRHGGGLGLWTRVGGDSSDVLRARDDQIEYQWNGLAWVRLLAPLQQVLRVNASTYTVSGGDHLVDLVFHGQPCAVTVPNNLGTRTRFRLVQEGTAKVTLVPASGVNLMPTIGAPLATTGDGTALAVTIVGNSTGTSALCRIFRESPTAGGHDGGTINLAAVDLSRTAGYDDLALSGNVTLALSGAPHVGDCTATVRVTGNGHAVAVDNVTVFWADGTSGAKSWANQRTLTFWFHPALGVALALVPDAGGAGLQPATAGTTFDPTACAFDRHRTYRPLTISTAEQFSLDGAVTPINGSFILVTVTFSGNPTLTWDASFVAATDDLNGSLPTTVTDGTYALTFTYAAIGAGGVGRVRVEGFPVDPAAHTHELADITGPALLTDDEETTSFTLALTHADQKMIRCNHASTPIIVTVPPNSSVMFPVGTVLTFVQWGSASVTFTQGSGVTIRPGNNYLIDLQYGVASLWQQSLNTWLLYGNIEAA